MRNLCLVVIAVCLLSSAGLAQFRSDTQWKCSKASVQHSIDVGDMPGHAYVVDQINCLAAKGELAGVKQKAGVGTEFLEFHGDRFTGHGHFVETLENGEKNFYTYELKGTVKNGVLQAASDTWSLHEGVGKLKGARASGSCKGAGNADGSATWDCAGNYFPVKK